MTILYLTLTIILILTIYFTKKENIKINKYQLTTDKTPESLKIAFITDYHNQKISLKLRKKIEELKKIAPDLIILGGDIFEEGEKNKHTLAFLEELKESAPIYYVTGNHEYYPLAIDNLEEVLEKYHIKKLAGNIVEIKNNIFLSGIDDPRSGNEYIKEYSKLKGELKEKGYNILIAHRPERFYEYQNLKVDLILSGHAHGGQIRIPLLFPQGLYSPNQGLFPKRTGGIYQMDAITHIVTTGLGNRVIVPRINNPQEILIIEIN